MVMIIEPVIWDWSTNYVCQAKRDLASLKTSAMAEILAIIKIDHNIHNLCLIDVDRSKRKIKFPVCHWLFCNYRGEMIYSVNDKILGRPAQKERMIDILNQNHPDSLEWLLFHPEWF